jgi:uncharacterized membrane protein HdeD (DUF308 family)
MAKISDKRIGRSIGPVARNGRARVLLGVAAGLGIVAWPDEWLSSAVLPFGIYGALDGILSLAGVFIARDRYWQRAAQGSASLAIGVFAIINGVALIAFDARAARAQTS